MKRTLNTTINRSKNEKNDEHYTQLADIENEVRHYRDQFRGKTVLCNCDDPRCSNFFKYFTRSFEILGLKRVIATCYKSQDVDLFTQKSCEKAVYQIYDGDANGNREVDDEEVAVKELEGDGSFDSPECLRLLDKADIVVTNPPFSRFIDFLTLLINRGKKFLILGNNFHAKAKEIFPYFMSDQLWLGYNYGNMNFMVPNHYRLEGNRAWVDERGQKWHSLGNIVWYTNLEVKKRHEPLTLFKKYDPAVNIARNYVVAEFERQGCLERAIQWFIGKKDDKAIREYMAERKKDGDTDASELWSYFSNVITWIEAKFKHTSDRVKILRGLDWGHWYAEYGKAKLDTAKIEKETQRLLKDKDVTKKSGIIPYLLTGDERYLSIRTFDDDEKLAAYTRQGGTCVKCGKHFAIEEMQADHITPWAKGGKTVAENCQMLCADCNRRKSDA